MGVYKCEANNGIPPHDFQLYEIEVQCKSEKQSNFCKIITVRQQKQLNCNFSRTNLSVNYYTNINYHFYHTKLLFDFLKWDRRNLKFINMFLHIFTYLYSAMYNPRLIDIKDGTINV